MVSWAGEQSSAMPWKETKPMHERLKFIAAAEDETRTFVSICKQFGITTKTGYKWLARYHEEGPEGLEEKKRTTRACPHRTADALVNLILALRKEQPSRGPKKLRAMLREAHPELAWPAPSTIGDVIKRYGLITPRKKRVRVMPSTQPFADVLQPNDLWCIDFKGHFPVGGVRCHPLTLTDSFSRYLIKIESLVKTHVEPVRKAMELAFREFGLPARIRSDNGPPFASLAAGGLSWLSVWWIQLGIVPERIEPGQPQQNGRHERFHRTLNLEALKEPAATMEEQQRIFDLYRREYNERRPHEALGQTPPAKHYSSSSRPYPRELIVPSYGDDFQKRWVNRVGHFSWRGKPVMTHAALDKQPIGIRQIGEATYEAWYGPVLLGYLDDRDEKPKLRRHNAQSADTQTPASGKESPVSTSSEPG